MDADFISRIIIHYYHCLFCLSNILTWVTESHRLFLCLSDLFPFSLFVSCFCFEQSLLSWHQKMFQAHHIFPQIWNQPFCQGFSSPTTGEGYLEAKIWAFGFLSLKTAND